MVGTTVAISVVGVAVAATNVGVDVAVAVAGVVEVGSTTVGEGGTGVFVGDGVLVGKAVAVAKAVAVSAGVKDAGGFWAPVAVLVQPTKTQSSIANKLFCADTRWNLDNGVPSRQKELRLFQCGPPI